jgi:hypothetical protein
MDARPPNDNLVQSLEGEADPPLMSTREGDIAPSSQSHHPDTTEYRQWPEALVVNAEVLASRFSNSPESERGGFLDSLGMELLEGFQRTGSIDALDKAIAIQEQAVESTADSYPDHPMYLTNLANALHSRSSWLDQWPTLIVRSS